MKIIHRFGRLYDCFAGEGWENHTQIELDKKYPQTGVFYHKDGVALTNEQVAAIQKNLVLKKHYQTV